MFLRIVGPDPAGRYSVYLHGRFPGQHDGATPAEAMVACRSAAEAKLASVFEDERCHLDDVKLAALYVERGSLRSDYAGDPDHRGFMDSMMENRFDDAIENDDYA